MSIDNRLAFIGGFAHDENCFTPLITSLGITAESTQYAVHQLLDKSSASWAKFKETVQDSSATVIGWSMGGIIALEAAQLIENSNCQIVVISSTSKFAFNDSSSVSDGLGLPLANLRALQLELQKNRTLMLEGFIGATYNNTLSKQELDEKLKIISDISDETLLNCLQYIETTDLRKELLELSNKTMIIHGEQDPIIPLGAAKYLAEILPNAELKVIPEAGHAVLYSNHDEVSTYVGDFIRRV